MVRIAVFVCLLFIASPLQLAAAQEQPRLDRVRMESFISMAESSLSESVIGANLPAFLAFLRKHVDENSEIWVRQHVKTGYETAEHGILTLNKNQLLLFAAVTAYPFLSSCSDYSVDMKLIKFDPAQENKSARALVEVEESMSTKMPIPGGEETVTVKVTTSCDHDVRLADNGEDIVLGNMLCQSEVRL